MSRFNRILGRALGLALLALSSFACDKDPVKPEDETKNKLHENPAKVVYTLEKCYLPEGVELSYKTLDQIQKSGAAEDKQTLVWEIKSDGTWGFGTEVESFEVESVVGTGDRLYSLKIEYFSPSGQPMNYQFVQNGQDKIHQHFFSLYKEGMLVRTAEELPYRYYYADKTDGKLTGESNPLGFEGYLQFTEPISTLNIKAELLHAYQSKYLSDATTSPFYMADRSLKSRSTMDISVSLPFRERGLSPDAPGAKPGGASEEDKPVDMTTTKLSGINTTKVHKIVLGLYEGHLHGMDFHYVPGPTGLSVKNLSIEQEMTIERRGTHWEITSGDIKQFLVTQSKVYSGDKVGTPVYGLWVDFYDSEGNYLNGEYGESKEYQLFFVPEHLRTFSSNAKSTILPSQVYKYYYRDSKPWDRNSQNGGVFNGDVNPIGLKGFFAFPQGDLKFMLNVELWHTPKGKRASESESFAPAYEVSSHIRKTGSLKLSVSVPTYVWLDNDALGNIEADSELSSFSPLEQAVIKATCELLGITWEKVREERETLFYGERGDESTGRWF